MRKTLFILFIFFSFVASAQKIQYVNTYGYEYQRVVADTLLGLPKDTFAVPTSLRTIPFLANKSGSIYKWNISTFVWDLFSPGNTYTASQGIALSGNDFQLGGPISNNNTISFNYNKKYFRFRTAPNGDSADFNFIAVDSISNPDNYGATSLAVLWARKVFKIPSYAATTYHGGAAFDVEYQIKDSATVSSVGGDFGWAVRADMNLTRMPDYTGRSVYNMGNGSLNDNVPVHLANLDWGGQTSTAGTNYKYVRGYVSGHQSYLYMNVNDTLGNWIGFNNMGVFLGGYVPWSADYVGGYFGSASSARIGKPWSLYMWNARSENYLAGKLHIGDTAVDASSILAVTSTTKGMLPPRMTAVQKNAIASPAPSLFLWDNDSTRYMGYSGSAWKGIAWTDETGRSGTINSGTQYRLGYYATTGTAISEAPAITASRALVSDVNGLPVASTTSTTRLQYLNAATGTTGTVSSNIVFSTTPTFMTNITTPSVIGGTSTTQTLTYKTTTGVGATGADHIFQVGNNGATEAMRILNSGNIGIGSSSATYKLSIGSAGKGFDVYDGNANIKVVNSSAGATLGVQNTNASGFSGIEYLDNAGNVQVFTGYNNLGQQFRFNNIASGGYIDFMIGGAVKVRLSNSGNVGMGGETSPSAKLHIAAGTATANTAPLKFTSGVILTTPESGAVETNAANELFYSTSTTAASRGYVSLGRYAATATSITADATHNVIDVTATGQTITLPTAVGIRGRTYTMKLTASGTGTVATTSSQTIDGSTTYSLSAQYKYVTVMSDNANWIIIGNN